MEAKANIRGTIEILKKLQEVDRQLAHVRRMEEYEPKRLAAEEARVSAEEGKLKSLGDRHGQTQRDISRKELDVKARLEKITRLKTQMLSASTNKEYQAFLREVSLEEAEKSRVEDEILDMMVSTEDAAAEEKNIKAEIARLRGALDTVRADVKAALAEASRREVELAKARADVAAALDPDTLRRYEAIFKSRGGEAVVEAKFESGSGGEEGQYLCRGCFMPLTHQMVNLMHIGQDIVTCKSCGRILFIGEKEDK